MKQQKIGLVDCGVGNFRSLINALDYLGFSNYIISNQEEELQLSDRMILPGVGSFSGAISRLKKNNLLDFLYKYPQSDRPLLGICLGMQLLFNSSTEGGLNKGLSLFKGDVIHFTEHKSYIPHDPFLIPNVGLNTISASKNTNKVFPIFKGIPDDSKFYFTHSYCVPADQPSSVFHSEYGPCRFTSVASMGNIYGVQFHPELSREVGLALISNFFSL